MPVDREPAVARSAENARRSESLFDNPVGAYKLRPNCARVNCKMLWAEFIATQISPELAASQSLTPKTTELFATIPGVCPFWRTIRPAFKAPHRRKSLKDNVIPITHHETSARIFRHEGQTPGELFFGPQRRFPALSQTPRQELVTPNQSEPVPSLTLPRLIASISARSRPKFRRLNLKISRGRCAISVSSRSRESAERCSKCPSVITSGN